MKDVQVVAGLLVENGEILLVRQHSLKLGKDYWTLPAGKVEFGESLWEALKREFLEETGLTVHSISRVAYVAQCLSETANTRWTTHAFLVSSHSGSINIQDPDNIVLEAKFFKVAEAKKLIAEEQPLLVMKDPVLHALDFKEHSDYWVVKQDKNGHQSFALTPHSATR